MEELEMEEDTVTIDDDGDFIFPEDMSDEEAFDLAYEDVMRN